ncbi:hypothetical protein [Pseudomonas sp. SL4(2022)]|uniref:hypothetical protein n=1 Tax=Pseudomonas sp. SL4(2022) TaxID=2994661 RepID=UPI002D1E3AEC|nr:hypothetical protein [Pseudomonas sp. SL4(2022)]
MRMRNHRGAQTVRVKGKWRAVAVFLSAVALTDAAVEQSPRVVAAFDQVAGTGDLLNCAEEVEQGLG